jgi:hypothetical protein
VRTLLLLAVLLTIAGALVMTRRAKVKRQRSAELKTARIRALRKTSAPFVSASLRGKSAQEPPKAHH